MRTFVVIPLVASGHLAEADVDLGVGRIRWIEWVRAQHSPHQYDGAPEGRLVILIGDNASEREAQRIAEVLSVLVGLFHGPSGGMMLGAVEVPEAALTTGRIAAEEVAPQLDLFDPRRSHIDELWWPSDRPITRALKYISAVMRLPEGHEEGLVTALSYYRLATSNFSFLGDEVTVALGEEGTKTPVSFDERAQVEDAYHNTFKAIEALLGGEPSGRERRFADRLQAIGIDPDELVGFRDRQRERLIDVLRRIHETRDKRAAHGRWSPGREISYFELMEAHYAAWTALLQAVSHLSEGEDA